jgi:hypothetical protein
VEFAWDARQGQAQVIENQPGYQKTERCSGSPSQARGANGFLVAVSQDRYASDTNHAAGVLGDAFAAEEAFARRTLHRGFAEGVVQAALV